MDKMYDIKNSVTLTLGNSYTYPVTSTDKNKYSGFFLTAADTIAVSDGTDSINLTVAANEVVPLNNSITTITGLLANTIVWVY